MKKGLLMILFLVITICCNCSRDDTLNTIESKDGKENKEQEKISLIGNILEDFKGLIYLSTWYQMRDYDMEGGIVYMEECPIEKKVEVKVFSKKGKFYDMEEIGENIICAVIANDGTEKYFELIYLSTGLVSHCVPKWNNVKAEKITLELEKYKYYGKGSMIINQKMLGNNIFNIEKNKFIVEKNKEMVNSYFIKKIIGKNGKYRIWLEDFLPGDVYTYFIVEYLATGEKYIGIGKVFHEQSSNLIRVGLWDYKKCYYNDETMLSIKEKMKSSWSFENL